MEQTVISADCHIDISWLPEDLFVSRAPERLKDRMPRVTETERGRWWRVDGAELMRVAGSGFSGTDERYVPGASHRLDKMEEQGFFSDAAKGLFHPTDPAQRLKDQDIDGISGEVIYGILAVASGFAAGGSSIKDSEALATVYGIYNQWAADFCKLHPDRFVGLACLTSHDPQMAASQLRQAAGAGLRGAELNVSSAVKPIYQKEWDILWATAGECDMPISFHTVGLPYRKPDPEAAEECHYINMGINFTLFQLSGAEYMTSILLSGACDHHPDFKFVLGECGIGWLPYVLYRMDQEYEDRLFPLNLSMKPSDFWHRQGYSTFQDEPVTPELVGAIGDDNILWGSDYPHPDGIWPESRSFLERNLASLDQETRAKIIHHNAAKLYKFN